MKEVEKNEIKRLSDRLDAIRHQQADLSLVEAADKYAELEKEKATLEAEIARLREVHSQKLSKEAQKLMKMPFQRAITKKEQADMGKLKKSVRGLVVVHPMTALGREMGLQEMTGFSRLRFKFLSRRCNYCHSRFTRSCWHMQEPVPLIKYDVFLTVNCFSFPSSLRYFCRLKSENLLRNNK